MSLAKTVARTRSRIKEAAPPAGSITMADLDALGSVALDLEATALFISLMNYVDEERRENHVAILLEAATGALRQARATFEQARRVLGDRLSRRRGRP